MYAFVHIEKTAGTTLNSILRRSFGTGHCDIRLPVGKRSGDKRACRALVDADDLRRVRYIYRDLKGIAGHNVKAYGELGTCAELRFFTFLRNPAARFRSHFLNRCAAGHDRQDFERWIGDPWTHNWQTRIIAGEPRAEKAIELLATRFSFLGLTERFDESLALLGEWLGEPGFRPTYVRCNQLSDKRRPRDLAREHTDMSYLDSEDVRARIAAANTEDQKVYDFVESTTYPRQVSAHRGDLAAAVARLKRQCASGCPMAEPFWGRFVRNYVYKPLLHCRAV